MKKIRVVLFEKFNNKLTGYYLEGGRVVCFDNLIDFAKQKDVLWITNIPKSVLGDNITRIKADGFLNLYLKDILYEANALDKKLDEQLKILQKVIAAYIFSLKKRYGIRFNDIESSRIISDLIVNYISLNSKKIDSMKELNGAFLNKIESIANSIEYFEKGENKECIIYYPRYQHVLNLCRLPLPLNNWTPFPVEKILSSDKTIEEWVSTVSKKFYFFAKCKVTNIEGELSYFLEKRLDVRSEGWFSSPEILFIIQYSNISIIEMYLTEESVPLTYFASNKLFKEKDPVIKNSIHTGMLARSYLKSVLSDDKLKLQKSWVNIYDKLMMLKIAVYLKVHGFNVLSFGKGALKVEYTSSNKIELKKICDNFNLTNNIKIT